MASAVDDSTINIVVVIIIIIIIIMGGLPVCERTVARPDNYFIGFIRAAYPLSAFYPRPK